MENFVSNFIAHKLFKVFVGILVVNFLNLLARMILRPFAASEATYNFVNNREIQAGRAKKKNNATMALFLLFILGLIGSIVGTVVFIIILLASI